MLYDINWLFNIRGNDTVCTPVLTSYALVEVDQATLFVDESKISDEISKALSADGVVVAPYNTIFQSLEKLSESATVYLCEERVSIALRQCIKSKVVTGTELTELPKAGKI